MEKEDFGAPLRNAVEGIKLYVAQQVAYNKLLLSKKMTELSARMVLFLLILGISGFVLLFLSFAFASWYEYHYGELYVGYLILAGIYLLLALVIYIFRKELIFNPIRKITGGILFSEATEKDVAEAFSSVENLNLQIVKAREKLKKEEEELKADIDALGEFYSLSNIFQQFTKNAFNTFITTSNIARATYLLVQKLKRKKKPDQLKD
jgi:hypothetical protein